MKKYLMGMAAVGVALTMSSAAKADCGDISVAEMNWASAELMANVDKIILEEGYGCSVELVPGATMTTFASMNEKGQPDVAGELWTNAVAVPLEAAVGEGRLHKVNNGPITQLGEGWWVTPQFAEKYPELTTDIDALLSRPDLFPHPEDPSKGAFVGCPAGWGCQLANANLYRGFDMEAKGWLLIDPGSAAGLDGSMAKAAERGDNWLGYYWSPTAMIGKYGMVPVDMGEWAGKDNWDNCIVKPEQECADPKASSWTHSAVSTVITDSFKAKGGVAIDYLSKRTFPGPVMNGMLVYMADNQAGGEDAAIEFLMQHEDLWSTWVSADAAAKIKAGL
ncbi:MAG: glycine betaine ABC transporter substrate-binding protein [Candidatus Puniceispirillaceae bacterium]